MSLEVEIVGRFVGNVLEVFWSASGSIGQDLLHLTDQVKIPNQTFILVHSLNLGGPEYGPQCQKWDGVLGLSPQMELKLQSTGKPNQMPSILSSLLDVGRIPKTVFALFVDPSDSSLDVVSDAFEKPFVSHTTSELVLGGILAEHSKGCLTWHPLAFPEGSTWSMKLSQVRFGAGIVPSQAIVIDTTFSRLTAPAGFIRKYSLENEIVCSMHNHDNHDDQQQPIIKASNCSAAEEGDFYLAFAKCSADLTPIQFDMEEFSFTLDKAALLSRADPLIKMLQDLPLWIGIAADDLCFVNVIPTRDNVWILGEPFLHEMYVVFDFEKFLMGMAPRRKSLVTLADEAWVLSAPVVNGTPIADQRPSSSSMSSSIPFLWIVLVLSANVAIFAVIRRRWYMNRHVGPLRSLPYEELEVRSERENEEVGGNIVLELGEM